MSAEGTLKRRSNRRNQSHKAERDGDLVNIYQPISALYVEKKAKYMRVDVPLIDLHKIAVSWPRLSNKNASGRMTEGETRSLAI